MTAITRMKLFLQKPVWLLFVFGFFVILLLVANIYITGFVIGGDGLGYYAYLRSMFVDGDLQFANEFLRYNQFGQGVPSPYQRTVTDHVANRYFIGPALLWVPFFLSAHALTILAEYFGFALAPDGYSLLYQFFIGSGSIIYGLLGLVFIYKISIRFFHRNEALLSTGFIALGTNVFYYLITEPTMSHSMSMFAVSMFAFIWVKDIGNRQKGAVVLLGLTAGLMILIRPQNVFFLVLIALEWLGVLKTETGFVSHFRKQIIEVGLFGIALLLMLLPQFVVWKILYGHFLFYSYEGAIFNFADPHLLDSLFSDRHGLIIYTPILLPALAGVFLFLWKQSKIGAALIIAFILQWYLNASCSFSFGNTFGGRNYINCSFIFAIGLAMFLSVTKKWIVPIWFLFAALIVWNLLFIAQYTSGMLPHGEAVDFKLVWHNNFDVLSKIFGVFSKII